MARKPNYNFERNEREKAKAAKVAERTKAKADKTSAAAAEPGPMSDVAKNNHTGELPE